MQGINNNDAWRDKCKLSLGNHMSVAAGNGASSAWNLNDLPLISPFYATSPSIYSPYMCETPLLPNCFFFGQDFNAALVSNSDRQFGLSSPSFQKDSGDSGTNSLQQRDICTESNEAYFFGTGLSSSIGSFTDIQPNKKDCLTNFRDQQCSSPFIYSPSFESVLKKPTDVIQAFKCRCGAISPDLNASEEVSRKVFIGGIPAGTNEGVLLSNFSQFGAVKIDWPKKTPASGVPPEGYVFAIYEEEKSVVDLLKNCSKKEKRVIFQLQILPNRFAPVEVKAWNVANSVYIGNHGWRRFRPMSVFAGGLPRTCTAEFLAKAIEEAIGPVAYCTIEQDKFTRYPKGAAQVVFAAKESYVIAIAAHELHLKFPEGTRRIELKPFLAPNMPCSECGVKSNTKFCKALTCLAYYCDGCWKKKHNSMAGMVAHEASNKMHGKKNVV